jgi:hypothetical protein
MKNILYDLQHGFRKARSCESQLLPFIQELNASNNKNIQTDLIIMDFIYFGQDWSNLIF